MKIIRFDPFAEMQRAFEDMWGGMPAAGGNWDLAADVSEEGSNVIVEMNLPGINPDKLDISVENDILHVAGSREEEQKIKKKNYYRMEIRKGKFARAIPLPAPVEGQQAAAEYKDGVLKITLPKKKAAISHGQKITVKKL